jgi:hypothetical protein
MIEAYLMSDTSTERVQKHRKKKKEKECTQVSVYLGFYEYRKLKLIARETKRSYSEIFNFLIYEKNFFKPN